MQAEGKGTIGGLIAGAPLGGVAGTLPFAIVRGIILIISALGGNKAGRIIDDNEEGRAPPSQGGTTVKQ